MHAPPTETCLLIWILHKLCELCFDVTRLGCSIVFYWGLSLMCVLHGMNYVQQRVEVLLNYVRQPSKHRSQSYRKIQIKRRVSVDGPCIAFIPPARSVHPAAPLQRSSACCPAHCKPTGQPAQREGFAKTKHGLSWAVKHSAAGASVRLTTHAQLSGTCAWRCSCLGSQTVVFLAFPA